MVLVGQYRFIVLSGISTTANYHGSRDFPRIRDSALEVVRASRSQNVGLFIFPPFYKAGEIHMLQVKTVLYGISLTI